ncbi:hypothetical protein PR048_023192 [Dryococelus australis]|uniref:Uncharacterized protein n=1 Tax=Dryococelus australis TaxID=614101 RepID=A0ABQ9GTD5_9NEOP|nr:hypothetical protein PR048_023192 [Dryococelus australis]
MWVVILSHDHKQCHTASQQLIRGPTVYWDVDRGECLYKHSSEGDPNAWLHHRGSKLDPRSDLRSTQNTVAPFEFRVGLEIELKFISNPRNWRLEISIRDQQPSSTNIDESEVEDHEISLVQHFYIGTKIKLDPGSELGPLYRGSGKMLVQPGINKSIAAGWDRTGDLQRREPGTPTPRPCSDVSPTIMSCDQQFSARNRKTGSRCSLAPTIPEVATADHRATRNELTALVSHTEHKNTEMNSPFHCEDVCHADVSPDFSTTDICIAIANVQKSPSCHEIRTWIICARALHPSSHGSSRSYTRHETTSRLKQAHNQAPLTVYTGLFTANARFIQAVREANLSCVLRTPAAHYGKTCPALDNIVELGQAKTNPIMYNYFVSNIVINKVGYIRDLGMLCLYYSLIGPKLEYCSVIWNNITNIGVTRIENVQKYVFKLLCLRFSTGQDFIYSNELIRYKNQTLKLCREICDDNSSPLSLRSGFMELLKYIPIYATTRDYLRLPATTRTTCDYPDYLFLPVTTLDYLRLLATNCDNLRKPATTCDNLRHFLAGEYAMFTHVDVKQRFHKCSVYREQPITGISRNFPDNFLTSATLWNCRPPVENCWYGIARVFAERHSLVMVAVSERT